MATSDDQKPRIEAKVHDEEVKIVSIDEVTTGMMTFDSTNESKNDSSGITVPTPVSTVYLWYLGFAAQIPWTTILVYLPVLESVLGGELFAFAVGIAMGLACNIFRFLVVVFGRKFTFTIRVIWGSVFSALFTIGYFVIYLVPLPDEPLLLFK
jgi:hypothetical protein